MKPVAEFYLHRKSNSHQGHCKKCSVEQNNEYSAARKAADPEWAERRLAYRREWGQNSLNRLRARLNRFNIAVEQYEKILEAQGGKCAICGSEPEAVDHDHGCCDGNRSCGKCVRGVLCQSCNVGISRFKDDPKLLLAAIDYLEGWSCRVR